MRRFVKRRLETGRYLPRRTGAYTERYDNARGWSDFLLTDGIVVSYRRETLAPKEFLDAIHSHDYCEMHLDVCGDITVACDDETVNMTEGTVYFIAPGRSHAVRLMSPCNYERFVIYFRPDAFSFAGADSNFYDFTKRTGRFFVKLGTEEMQKAFSYANRIIGALNGDTARSNPLALSYLLRLISLVYDSAVGGAENRSILPRKMLDIKEYIDKHYLDIHCVEDVSKHFFYSREHLSRLFSKHYGVGISEYIANKKISHAVYLLDRGESVAMACTDAGFRNRTSFIRLFSECMGVTPAQYKKHRAGEHVDE